MARRIGYIGVLLSLLLFGAGSSDYYASENEVVFRDGEFLYEEEILWETKEVMPGDSWSESIHIKNDSEQTIEMRLKLVYDGENELKDKLTVEISGKKEGNWIANDVSTYGEINQETFLCVLKPQESVDIVLDMYLSQEADNFALEALVELEYEFIAEELDGESEVSPPGTGDDTSMIPIMIILSIGIVFIMVSSFSYKQDT